MDEDSEVTIRYLRGRPHGARIHWSTHHLSREEPWARGWVDVRIEDDDAPPFGWAWTIIGQDDPDGSPPGQLWQFAWPYDLDVHEVWGPVEPPRIIGRLMGTWAVPRGGPAPEEVAASLRDGPDRRHVAFGGWSADAVGEALAHWAATHAGRPDLRFAWDPDADLPPAVARAAERAREVAEGGATRDLGDGVVVAEGVMDDLLAMDPHDRDDVLQAFREVGRRSRPEDQSEE